MSIYLPLAVLQHLNKLPLREVLMADVEDSPNNGGINGHLSHKDLLIL